MFSVDYKVRLSEVGLSKEITLPSVVNFFQDTSMKNTDALGLGFDYLEIYKRTWVLTGWQIVIERYPKLGEDIVVKTWPTDFDKLRAQRNFAMYDKEGKICAWANSVWAFMDLEKGRPVLPSPADIEAYKPEPAMDVRFAPKNIEAPQVEAVVCETVAVKRSDIDPNGHVNNCRYIEIAEDLLPQTYEYNQVRVEYKRSAVLGDVIYPYLYEEEERIVVVLKNSEEQVYSIVEFSKY